MPKSKYVSEEAICLLGEYAERIRPSTKEYVNEADELVVEALASLMKERGFSDDPIPGKRDVEFMMANRRATVSIQRDGIYVIPHLGKATMVPLVYDRGTKTLRSTKVDPYRTPVPGEPIRYRSALAELVEATIAALERSLPPLTDGG